MLKNAPTLAIVAVHTAENEPLKNHRERERAPVVDVIWGDWFF